MGDGLASQTHGNGLSYVHDQERFCALASSDRSRRPLLSGTPRQWGGGRRLPVRTNLSKAALMRHWGPRRGHRMGWDTAEGEDGIGLRCGDVCSRATDNALAAAGERAGVRCRLAQALGRLGPLSCTRYRACTCGPCYLVVCQGPYSLAGDGRRHLGAGFALRCCQRFSRPDLATGRCRWHDNPHTSGPSAPVLSY